MLCQARRAWEGRLFKDAFNNTSRNLSLVVERELNLFVDVLESLGRLHSISGDVDRRDFEEFVGKGLIYHRYVLDVFGWAARVPRTERALYEAAMRQGGYSEFRVQEKSGEALVDAAERPEYFPVSYAEPSGAPAIPLGLDLAAEAANREAMTESRATGQTRIGGGAGTARFVFSPIYRGELPPGTARESRGDVDGFVVAALDPERVLRRALSYVGPQGIHVYVFDQEEGAHGSPRTRASGAVRGRHERARKESADAKRTLLYAAPARSSPAATAEELETWAGRSGLPLYRNDLSVAGRVWTVMCLPSSSFVDLYRTWQPWGLLVGGLLVTALVTSQLL
ncbi:MAG: CHASE domain-containing protein, partial [Phycisphaerae bacterium]|nr:CHASE domain-containing protein [Phycisphaerae bacterium]